MEVFFFVAVSSISEAEGKQFAAKNNLLFIECSSKDDIGINTAFENLINAVLDSPSLSEETATNKNSSIKVTTTPTATSSQYTCC